MKTTYILLFSLLFSLNTFAQDHDKEKVRALKVAHITEQLELTAKEAQEFWPIYNANLEAYDKLYNKSKEARKAIPENVTETEAKEHLEIRLKLYEDKYKLQRDYYAKLSKVLSSKKILKLIEADRSFKHKMIEQFKQRHKGEKRN
ncbi:hypothetical protein [Oceanihabitans sediminis]|uniref:Sensor of ECF-type sigma factor n=1 Tax=Oceanihabitans sediminis TaxID=1812012 RepID=A0A368P2H7_9FLAO|nr:hypothetical protein [Oceanihabitans sediminis]MDX1278952.1 hypothetical protein [Oceanihabitans sediminis]MDX1774575.1 hypothetical protein [Oceanihabitans sediminis]RBP29028.1 hypothetical protein DFR65_10648 [Oceanihabitans sediminis]RCU57042.1 hypothetical protein DU428_08845 [Oceanihabitans sediminis]